MSSDPNRSCSSRPAAGRAKSFDSTHEVPERPVFRDCPRPPLPPFPGCSQRGRLALAHALSSASAAKPAAPGVPKSSHSPGPPRKAVHFAETSRKPVRRGKPLAQFHSVSSAFPDPSGSPAFPFHGNLFRQGDRSSPGPRAQGGPANFKAQQASSSRSGKSDFGKPRVPGLDLRGS